MMTTANQPEPSLREQIEIGLLWLTHTMTPTLEKSVIDCVITLLTDKEAAIHEAYNKGWIDCQRSKAEHRRLHKEQL